jgi:hypothetical protein
VLEEFKFLLGKISRKTSSKSIKNLRIQGIQEILAGHQPESGRAVPDSLVGKIIYWSPEFC